jgi:hypothetical protein
LESPATIWYKESRDQVDLAPAQARAASEIRDVLSKKQVQTEDPRWMPQGITNRLSLYR